MDKDGAKSKTVSLRNFPKENRAEVEEIERGLYVLAKIRVERYCLRTEVITNLYLINDQIPTAITKPPVPFA